MNFIILFISFIFIIHFDCDIAVVPTASSLGDTLFKTGTTIVGICCSDGVVLGADTRSTGGSLIVNKNTRKIHQLSNCIFCCGAGTAGDCDYIKAHAMKLIALNRVNRNLSGDYSRFDSMSSSITSMTRFIHNHKKFTYRKPEAVFIVGGVDASGPLVCQIDSKGVVQKSAYTALGSGSLNAMAVIEVEVERLLKLRKETGSNHLSDGNYLSFVSVEEAVKIVRKAVVSGINNDLGSGSHVDICVVRSDGASKQWREHLREEKKAKSVSGDRAAISSSLGRLIRNADRKRCGEPWRTRYGLNLLPVVSVNDDLLCNVEIID